MDDQKKAYVLAAVSVLIWSTVASAFKLTLGHASPMEMVFYGSIVTIVVLFATIVLLKKLPLLKKSLSAREIGICAGLGLLNPFIYYQVLFSAYDALPAQEAQPLNYTWPIWLVLLSIPVLKQKIRPLSVFAIIVSFFGVIVIATRGDFTSLGLSSPAGILLGLASALIWAVFWLGNLKFDRDPLVTLFLCFCFGTVYIFVVLVATGNLQAPSVKGLIGSGYVGLFEMGVTFILWSMALKLTKDTARISNLIYLTPFLSLVFIAVFVGESIYFSTVLGLVFIVEGIVIQRLSSGGKKKDAHSGE